MRTPEDDCASLQEASVLEPTSHASSRFIEYIEARDGEWRAALKIAEAALEEIMQRFRPAMDGRTHHDSCRHLDCKAELVLRAIQKELSSG